MKTSVEIDSKKVELAKSLSHHHSTLKELIDLALDAFIARQKRLAVLGMLGKSFFEGDLSRMRDKSGRIRR